MTLALATLASAVTATQAAGDRPQAKPPSNPTATPVPPPLDGGSIYYGHYLSATGTYTVHEIDPDGSGDVTVADLDGLARPSRQLHNGTRWFLRTQDIDTPGFFPGGASNGRLFELELLTEGGTPIPLTDNAGSCIQMWGGGSGVRFNWAPDGTGQVDGAISWVGTRWEDVDDNGSCDQVVDGGIFRGAISIDGSGNVSFTQPTQPEIAVDLSGTSTRAAEFAWAPDGQQVAYKNSSGDDLWVASVGGGHSMIFNGITFDISWSPDRDPLTAGYQTRIAFTGRVLGNNGAEQERGTYTIAPDGTGRLRIAVGKTQKGTGSWSHHTAVHWSPAGTHLTYTDSFHDSTTTRTLRRLSAGGQGNVVLVTLIGSTNNLTGLGWTTD